jgi:hypothetical protein
MVHTALNGKTAEFKSEYLKSFSASELSDTDTLKYIQLISGEDYKLRGSILSSLLRPPVASTLLGSNILTRILFQTNSTCVLPLQRETKFHTHTE